MEIAYEEGMNEDGHRETYIAKGTSERKRRNKEEKEITWWKS